MWLLPLETKETLKSGKTQMQVGHVNSFGPGHIEDGLLLQFREKKQEETSNTSVAVHLEKRRIHFLYRSDNNAKMRSFAPIGIQLREMHPPQGYLHDCKHSIKFQDFH